MSKEDKDPGELQQLDNDALDTASGARGIFESIGGATGWWSPQSGKAFDIGSSLVAGFVPGVGQVYGAAQGLTDIATTLADPNASWGNVAAAVAGTAVGMIPGGRVL